MTTKTSFRLLAPAAVLVCVLGGAGYGAIHATHATTGTGTGTAPRIAATTGARATNPAAPTTAALAGTWVYKDALTVETLRLKAGKGGVVGGSGDSTVKSTRDPRVSGRFTIGVHDGRLRGNTLTLSLYVQQQFGNYATLVEYLSCTPTARVLHCRTHAQIAYKVYDSTQDFYRR